jgi:putative nucleotidyltransferase with HDIG domain
MEDVYVGGILHDMGKIIFSNVHPALLDKIKVFCVEKGLPSSTLEDLVSGMHHAEIGALIAEKWNFPENLVAAIRYHHDPLQATEENKNAVGAVYLANMFCEYESGNVVFDQFEAAALEIYGLSSKKQVDALLEKFARGIKQDNHR